MPFERKVNPQRHHNFLKEKCMLPNKLCLLARLERYRAAVSFKPGSNIRLYQKTSVHQTENKETALSSSL